MDQWDIPELRTGLAAGLAGAVVLVVVALGARLVRRGPIPPLPVGGVAIAAIGVGVVADTAVVPGQVVLGIAGVGIASGVPRLLGFPDWYAAVLALPVAWILAEAAVPEPGWVRVAVALTAALGGILAAAFDDAWRHESTGPTLLAITALGMFLAVPDTERAGALLGVAAAIALLGWPVRAVRLGRVGAGAAVAALVWAAAWGSRGRPAAVLAAAACLGLLAGVPLGRAVAPRVATAVRARTRGFVVPALVVVHLGLVAVAARVAGPRADPAVAGGVALAVVVAAVALGLGFAPPGEPDPDDD